LRRKAEIHDSSREVTLVAKEKGARKTNDKKPAQKTLKEKRQEKRNKAK